MANVQVTSGITVVGSGFYLSGQSGVQQVSATPVNIFGAIAADTSGKHAISDMSGALNVNISGGAVVVAGSGNTVLTLISGNVLFSGGNALSGSWIQPFILLGQDVSGEYDPINIAESGKNALAVTMMQGGSVAAIASAASDARPAGNAIFVIGFGFDYNGTNFDRQRTVTGSSGVVLGSLAAAPPLWKYTEINTAVITNVYQSGPVHLHNVVVQTYISGFSFRVCDSQSGSAGNKFTIGGVNPANTPASTLNYDILLTSGLVVDTLSGAYDVLVAWKNLTS